MHNRPFRRNEVFTVAFSKALAQPGQLLRQPRTWRIVITLALLVALGTLVDWAAVWRTALAASPAWLLAAAGCLLIAQLVITWRWLLILRAADAGSWRDFWPLFAVVSAGLGIGSILPTSVGPDVMRGVIFKTRSGGRDTGTGLLVSSLLIDRYAATFATLLVAIVGAALIGNLWLAGGLGIVTLAVAAVTWTLVTHSNTWIRAFTPGPLKKVRPKVETLITHIRQKGMFQNGLLPAIGVSILLVIVRTGLIISLYYAFGFAVPIAVAFFAVPILLIALMAPVTIGGFGLREWVLVVLFAGAGSSDEISVAVGLSIFFLQLVTAAPWIVQMLLPQRTEPTESPAE